ncbi:MULTISPECIES: hypothetical protein [Lactococcus]|jgi:hypothetical protein|uniref:hypothetical protein n=1 Tax=Lactococcus TaxID=1357 RepID=UPI00024D8DFF|nr:MULTISPECIES: hypothetical protein [Lactococcus]MCA2380408.1 hypothetical protein [Lactococcus sp. SK2-659]MCI2095459.1 hypothetical protein [Lactococcus lactis]MCI2138754.1 hypothetical protein [Lactococcus lactis]MCT1173376.1 hypothetical protein [Lactococcus lactis]MCT1184812.1 hypothetical protein [Lactococcus lactis]
MNNENLLTEIETSFQKGLWVNRTDEFFVNQFEEVEIKRIESKTPTSLFLNSIKIADQKEHVFQFSCEIWIENFFNLTRSDAFLMLTVLSDTNIVQNVGQKMLGSKIEKQAFVSANMENLTSGKWKRVVLNIKTRGKIFNIALHLSGNGWLKYKGLTLIETQPSDEVKDYILL